MAGPGCLSKASLSLQTESANPLLRTGLQCLALLLESLQGDMGASCLSCCTARAQIIAACWNTKFLMVRKRLLL